MTWESAEISRPLLALIEAPSIPDPGARARAAATARPAAYLAQGNAAFNAATTARRGS